MNYLRQIRIGKLIFKEKKSWVVEMTTVFVLVSYLCALSMAWLTFFSLDDKINAYVENRTIEIGIDKSKEQVLFNWAVKETDVESIKSLDKKNGDKNAYQLIIKSYDLRINILEKVPESIGLFSVNIHPMDHLTKSIGIEKIFSQVLSIILLIGQIIFLCKLCRDDAIRYKSEVNLLRNLGFKRRNIRWMFIYVRSLEWLYMSCIAMVFYLFVIQPLLNGLGSQTAIGKLLDNGFNLEIWIIPVSIIMTVLTTTIMYSLVELKSDNEI